ncbi:MAG: tetratricopeptide repeat protein [Candidatus Obscuribacterales bacterium]|nr:tetratricopeptide repeat protein [Candidatus Obscuribacterales bacterium]
MHSLRKLLTAAALLSFLLNASSAHYAFADQAYDDYVRAQRAIQNAQWNPAVTFLSRSINAEPKYLNAYIARGFAYSRLGKNEEALADYDRVLKIAPQNAVALSNKGFCLYLSGNLDEALVCLDKAHLLDPERGDILANRGEVYLALGDFQKAVNDCTQAIKFDDTDADCYITRGQALIKLNNKKQALKDFSKAISLNPDPVHMFHQEGESYYLRGQLYSAMGKNDLASRDIATSQSLHYRPSEKSSKK